jgi:hypothetical protein
VFRLRTPRVTTARHLISLPTGARMEKWVHNCWIS